MRRIRHLQHCDYVVHMGQRINQLLTLSKCNIVLERTWHQMSRNFFEIKAHVKFNADTMNGLQIMTRLDRNGVVCSSNIPSVNLYLVNEANWTETLITAIVPTESPHGVFTALVNQATLGANELSGKEVYALEVTAFRKRKKFVKKFWFNQLGCFDSILRLKNEMNYVHILKLDE